MAVYQQVEPVKTLSSGRAFEVLQVAVRRSREVREDAWNKDNAYDKGCKDIDAGYNTKFSENSNIGKRQHQKANGGSKVGDKGNKANALYNIGQCFQLLSVFYCIPGGTY